MADIPGSIKVTDINFITSDSNIISEGDVTISGSSVVIQNIKYPDIDGSSGQVLTTDGAGNLGWTTGSGGGGAATLNDLLDVSVSAPQNFQVLQYNSGAGVWQNATFSVGNFGLNNLNDVTLTAPAVGELLSYNGTNWVNNSIAISALTDVDTVSAPPINDNALMYDNGTWVPGLVVKPGDNVSSLTNDAGYITSAGAGEANTASNLGAGEGVFAQKDTADLQFKSLVAGTNITLASDSTSITITGTVNPDTVFKGNNVSDLTNDAGYISDITGESLGSLADVDFSVPPAIDQVLSWNGSAWVPKADQVTDITNKADKVNGAISGNFAGLDLEGNLTDSGVAASDLATNAQGALADSAIQPGDNISALTNDANYVSSGDNVSLLANDAGYITAGDVPAPGEENTASNLGAGEGVFAQKTGTDLQFKSLVAGNNVSITSSAETILISASGPGQGGSYLTYKGEWESDVTYNPGDVVTDRRWTMVATATTTDSAAPYLSGIPSTSIPSTETFSISSGTGRIDSGHTYTFAEDGWVGSLRYYIPVIDPNYRYWFYIVNVQPDDSRVLVYHSSLPDGILTQPGWISIKTSTLVAVGSKYDVGVIVENIQEGQLTPIFTEQWQKLQSSDSTDPTWGGLNTNNAETLLRIHQNAINNDNYRTQLLSLQANDIVEVATTSGSANHKYRLTAPGLLVGSVIKYNDVQKIENIGGISPGSYVNVTASSGGGVSSTDYPTISTFWATSQPSWATIQGYYKENDNAKVVNDNAYGVDILFQPASVSPNWDILSYSSFAGLDITPENLDNEQLSATTDQLDTFGAIIGQSVFDTTLGKPVWWNGTDWVDSAGKKIK